MYMRKSDFEIDLLREPKQVEWARAWFSLLEEQRKYVLEYHTTGLTWNFKVSQLFIDTVTFSSSIIRVYQ